MTAKEEEAVLLTLILEVQVMNPSDPQFQGKTTPPSGLPVNPTHWVDQYGDDLYRYSLSRIGQPEVAEDVVQDTLLAAIKGLGRFDRRSSEKTWLLAGLEGAAATLMAEAMYYGVRCSVIHPGFTDAPMVRAIGEEYIRTRVIPQTQLKRLIKPAEIAEAICFMITNAAVSGELWADAGWRAAA